MRPDEILTRAMAAPGNGPVIRRVCLTSGGGDSGVLAHTLRHHYDELCHIDTGTALPGVRAHVENFAAWLSKPLRVVEAGTAYRELVLGAPEWWTVYGEHHLAGEGPDDFRRRCGRLETRAERMTMLYHRAPFGFPGPAGHKLAYQKLKERQLERALRDIKTTYGNGAQRQRVVLLSGVRMDESARRKMTGAAQGEWERKGNKLWVNPLLYWTNQEMADYRKRWGLPISDASALTHRSGECNCLAFAAKGEAEFVAAMYPDWFATEIDPLQQEARRKGLERWQWGWGAGDPPVGGVGPMCQGCEVVGKELR